MSITELIQYIRVALVRLGRTRKRRSPVAPILEETHIADLTPESDDPMSNSDEELRGSGYEDLGVSEGNQSPNGFTFYTPNSSNPNAWTNAFWAKNSLENHSTIQVSAMKFLRPDATVGTKYTLSWRIEKVESIFSSTFEVIPDPTNGSQRQPQVVIGIERSSEVDKGQSWIPSSLLPDQSSAMGR
ncbi:uncharacterized protein GGS22DRAFT_114140 [Annulohypoxylon maeteangense]|uniref:uncharacterized protein n=1 Tax=Annulohypoxylon maeteangense TaxID=1927788 RepID=UPI00200855EB|nr:uncharacterized protein GGS22DRAFT_114140 [Annulohypoxylon maeteangense]KAI0886487.1 hypothetical protein GGS22DRAFT_114140 [Annulohypoxylon maeteangense]